VKQTRNISLLRYIMVVPSVFAQNPASVRFWLILIFFIKSTEIRRNIKMWKPGDEIAWRGIYRNQVWHAIPTTVVKDTDQETVLFLSPGAQGMVEEGYTTGRKGGKRRWDFKHKNWQLENFTWHTNRLLFILEPEKYYSTIYYWNHKSNEFLCYYINFQIPFRKGQYSLDTLDLDLDLVIYPDFSPEWKDLDDYQKAIDYGIIPYEWTREVEKAKQEVLNKLEGRQYPLNKAWIDWTPDPTWSIAMLPKNWDKL
jgi:protein associated with RNAse G/E